MKPTKYYEIKHVYCDQQSAYLNALGGEVLKMYIRKEILT